LNGDLKENAYFDHDADIGIIGRGETVELCFADAARQLFALMGDLKVVKPLKTIRIDFHEADLDFAFVSWLNLLLAQAHSEELLLSEFTLHKTGTHWHGQASGEAWREGIERGTDVKGATLTMLSVQEKQGLWEARCVVDV
jgi:SHS2 domain-containing protein